jgi:pyruvate-formate lyase-activating enzyme
MLNDFGYIDKAIANIREVAEKQEENIKAAAEFVCGMKNLVRYELLNFNPLGEGKYKSLDAENLYEKVRPHGEEKLTELRAILGGVGVAYKIV